MFKRITKKQEKQGRDEELGLDEETKQVLGMHDTDTDESDSEVDSDSDLDSDNISGLDDELDVKRSDANMKMEWLKVEGGGSEDEDESDEEGLDLDEDLEDGPPMTLNEALKNPIYTKSMDADLCACIACPKKFLKNSKMVEVHLKSAAHTRRYAKFCDLAQNQHHKAKDPRRVTAAISHEQKTVPTNAEGMSHRGLKRKMKLEAIKKKRTLTKQIIERKRQEQARKAQKGPSDREDAPTERPRKKRKVAKKDASEGNAETPSPAAKVKAKDGVECEENAAIDTVLHWQQREAEAEATANAGPSSNIDVDAASPNKKAKKSKSRTRGSGDNANSSLAPTNAQTDSRPSKVKKKKEKSGG